MDDLVAFFNVLLCLLLFLRAEEISRLGREAIFNRRRQEIFRRRRELLFRRLTAIRTRNRLRLSSPNTLEMNSLEQNGRVFEALNYFAIADRMQATGRVMNLQLTQLIYYCTRRRPTVWEFNRSSQWWDVIVPGFTDAQWLHNFRMSEQTFNYLCNKLRPALERQNTTYRQCVPVKKRVAVALWKFATGSEYRSVGHLFGVSVMTVCRCVREFCAAAETLLVPEQIRMPTEEKFREMATYIENRWGLPHCVGAIDGSHIPIIAPQQYHTDYFNRKGWHSIILQAVVDGKGLFWNVFAGMPGSLHDARVLRLSTLWELAMRGNLFPAHNGRIGTATTGYYILGDSAYPLQNWLLKPFPDTGRLTAAQQMYNQRFSSARVVVENAFGRLKGRWRCLLKRNDSDLHLVKSMVLTCCALHNLCESHGETYETFDELDAEPAAQPLPVAVLQDGEQGNGEQGLGVRDALMEYLMSRN